MQRPQEILIKTLKSRVHKKLSFIDLISSILNINYDAAYRRVNNKTAISLDEAVTLAKHFNVSLNSLYDVGEKDSVLVTKSPHINNAYDLEEYFIDAHKKLSALLRSKYFLVGRKKQKRCRYSSQQMGFGRKRNQYNQTF